MKIGEVLSRAVPSLVVVAIVTMAGAVVELRALIVKVDYIEKSILLYHKKD